MRLVCSGVATGMSHTTSGAPTSSMAILDRVTGQPIALVGVGGGVVRSLMRTFQGNLSRLPSCVVVLSQSVMTFVDLPVYLQLMALQKVRVTVLAPSTVLDIVVQYVEDVLSEEDPSVALAVQRLTRFVDLDPDAPTVLPTAQPTSSMAPSGPGDVGMPGTSSSPAAGPTGRRQPLRNIRNDFDDVVVSQWLLFVHKTASPVREDTYRYNAVVMHRRVVLDGASKHKAAAAAALETAIGAASTLSHLDEVVKEDTTTMLAVVDHIPTAPEALLFVAQCDAVLTTLADEAMVRQCLFRAPTTEGQAGEPLAPLGSPATDGPVATHRKLPAVILYRFPAHEPPLTFHPETFVAQPSCAYSILPAGCGVTVLGTVAPSQPEASQPSVQRSRRAAPSNAPPATAVVDATVPQMSPLGAKQVAEDASDSEDDGRHTLSQSQRRHNGIEPHRAATMPSIGSAAIVQLRRDQLAQQHDTKPRQPLDDPSPTSPSAPFDPETCPFASSLRAEHYDAGMSQLAEMQRQLGVEQRWGVAMRPRHDGGGNLNRTSMSPHHTRRVDGRRGRQPTRMTAAASPSPRRGADRAESPRSAATHDANQRRDRRLVGPQETVFHCCCFDESTNGAPPVFVDVVRPTDPLVCDPLSLGTTPQGRMQLEDLVDGCFAPSDVPPALCAAFVQFMRRVQFAVSQWTVTRRMQQATADDDNSGGPLGSWRAALQSLLSQGVRAVLEATCTALAIVAAEDEQRNHRQSSPSPGSTRRQRHERPSRGVPTDRVGAAEAHHACRTAEHTLQALSQRIGACCVAVVLWRSADGGVVDGYGAFGTPSPTTQYDVVVVFQ